MAFRLSRYLRLKNPATILGDEYDFIVVGAGASGCTLASRLCSGGRTLLLDAASEPADNPDHWEIPCAPAWHRGSNRYIRRTPARIAADPAALTTALQNIACGDDAHADFSATDENQVPLLSPNVVGGSSMVLGHRSWIRGHAEDWTDFPISGADVVEHYNKLENAKGCADVNNNAHRSGEGDVMLSKLLVNNPLYKPVLEAAQKLGVLMTAGSFNESGGFKGPGFGRAETMVCPIHRTGYTSLSAVKQALKFHKPLTVVSDTEAVNVSLAGEFNGKIEPGNAGRARKVNVRNVQTGEERTIVCNRALFVCAGALKTPEFILRSAGLCQLLGDEKKDLVGKNLWAVPTATVQFKTTKAVSLASAGYSIVRGMNWLEWRYNVHKNGWCNSNFDDLVGYINSSNVRTGHGGVQSYPNIRIQFQPFMTDKQGKVIACHGCQFVVSLARPESRGSVSMQDGQQDINTGAFSNAEDLQALQDAVKFVHMMATQMGPAEILGAADFMDPKHSPNVRIEMDGPVGGTVPLGSLVTPDNMLLTGTSNIHVCDGSVIPRPMLADPVPLSMALARRCADQFVIDQRPSEEEDDSLLYNSNLGSHSPKDVPIDRG